MKNRIELQCPDFEWVAQVSLLRPGFLRQAVSLGLLLVVACTSGFAQMTGAGETSLTDATALAVSGGKAEPVEYLGRKAIRLTTEKENDIFAFVNGTAIQDGAIDVDIAVKITTPPGVRMPGFAGIAFRARPDGSHYDMFYLRPRNSLSDDQAMRNHSVQYVAKPGFDWYPLRRQWPSVYESWADLQPEKWAHVKIDVHGRSARLFINGSDHASLVINGLKGEDLQGGIALWGYPGEESYFSNLRVTPEKPEPIHNGGDAAGTWTVTFASDYGRFTGTMDLHREATAISGSWSGAFGNNRAITGTWRDGYVQLTFSGQWEDDNPGPVTATMAGWIDGDRGTGRMKAEGRADGLWGAERKK